MYIKLNMGKVAKSSLETGTAADTNDMEEEDIVDEVETAASSTLTVERRNEMGWLPCALLTTKTSNLAEKHEPAVGWDLSLKIDLVLADPLHKVRRDQNDDYLDYDVYALNDMKAMAKL